MMSPPLITGDPLVTGHNGTFWPNLIDWVGPVDYNPPDVRQRDRLRWANELATLAKVSGG